MKKLCYIKQVLMVRLKMKICHCLLFKVKVKLLTCVRFFATPWTVAHQAPLSMGFSRQEYWSGLPFLSPGDLPDSGIEPGSPALQADALLSEAPELTLKQPGIKDKDPPCSRKSKHNFQLVLSIISSTFPDSTTADHVIL